MIVTEQKGAVADHEIDVAVAVKVPLVRAVGAIDIDREGLVNALVVLDSIGKNAPGTVVHLAALRAFFGEETVDLRRRLYFSGRHLAPLSASAG